MDFLLDAATKATASSGAQAAPTGSIWGMLIPMVIMFAILYFFMIRPQKKRDKEVLS